MRETDNCISNMYKNTTDIYFHFYIKFNKKINWYDVGPAIMGKFKQHILCNYDNIQDLDYIELTNGLNTNCNTITMRPDESSDFKPGYYLNGKLQIMSQEQIEQLMPLYDKYWHDIEIDNYLHMAPPGVNYYTREMHTEMIKNSKIAYETILKKTIEMKLFQIPNELEIIEYVKNWCENEQPDRDLKITSLGWGDIFMHKDVDLASIHSIL